MTWVLLLGASSLAHAQTGEAELLDREARANFEAGRLAYEDARYADALGYFERAYELSERPELLYNVGQSLDRLRRDAEAVDAFERFLEAVPETHKRNEVEARLEILRGQVAEVPTPEETAEAALPRETAPPPPTTSEPSRGWIAGVVAGAVAVVLGVVLAVVLTRDGGTAPVQAGDFGMTGVLEL